MEFPYFNHLPLPALQQVLLNLNKMDLFKLCCIHRKSHEIRKSTYFQQLYKTKDIIWIKRQLNKIITYHNCELYVFTIVGTRKETVKTYTDKYIGLYRWVTEDVPHTQQHYLLKGEVIFDKENYQVRKQQIFLKHGEAKNFMATYGIDPITIDFGHRYSITTWK
jgi:hypothetical protein